MSKVLVAAYGTLRKGYSNSRLVDKPTTKHIGTGTTVNKYQMIASGIPFVNKTPDTNITVDIWEIDEEKDLPSVDRLEGHPEWYKRELIDVKVDDTIYKAWLYFCDRGHGKIVESGDFNIYTKQR